MFTPLESCFNYLTKQFDTALTRLVWEQGLPGVNMLNNQYG